MRTLIAIIFIIALAAPAGTVAAEKGLTVTNVRYATYTTFTRIVFEVESAAPYVLTRSQDNRSIMVGSYEGTLVLKSPLPLIHDGVVAGMEPWEEGGRTYAVIRLDAAAGQVKDFTLRSPDRIVLDISKIGAADVPAPRADRPVMIVLDPGHGGKDPGLIMGQGIEKNADLELAQAVRKLLRKADRFRVMVTRQKDQTLSLDERAAMANAAGASLFVGIHAGPGNEARVYIEDFIEDRGAAVQSRPVGNDFLVYEAQSEQQKQVWGVQQAAHLQQSGGLARMIVRKLEGRENAEPIQAPMVGLRAIDAAAVMVEVGMEYDRARAAEAIAGGIEQYVLDNR